MIWRWFWREWRSPSLLIVWLALTLAMACSLALGNISSKMERVFNQHEQTFLAGDRVLRSSHEIDSLWLEKAKTLGLKVSQQASFITMTYANGQPVLASVKAADLLYPLYGHLDTQPAELKPQPGEVLISPRLQAMLNLSIGDKVEVGDIELTVSGILLQEPDSGFNPLDMAPRILINLADLSHTGAIQPGSRIVYRYMFAGTPQAIEQYSVFIKDKLTADQRWISANDSNNSVSLSLQRADHFLFLSSLLTLILSSAAVAIAMGHYCRSRYDLVAVLKTLGAGKVTLTRLIVGQWLLILITSVVAGIGVGYSFEYILLQAIKDILPDTLPSAGFWPVVTSFCTIIVISLLVSIRPYCQLLATRPFRVLRRDNISAIWPLKYYLPLTLFIIAILLAMRVGFNSIWWTMLAGILSLAIILGLIGWCSLIVLRRIILHHLAGRLAVSRLLRQPKITISQLATFSLSFMLLALLFSLRGGLLERWQQLLPENSPNYYMVNISAEQIPEIKQTIKEYNIEPDLFYPVVLTRLTAINDVPVKKLIEPGSIGYAAIDRELNVTELADLPAHNQLVKGQWPLNVGEVSIEEGLAARLNVKVGDKLSFSMPDQEFSVRISNIRHVDWESLQLNFYFIFPPDTLDKQSQRWMSSFHYDNNDLKLITTLNRQFPTVSIIDVNVIIAQLNQILMQVSQVIKVMVILVIICGTLLLMSQVQIGMQQRYQELKVYRILGANNKLLRYTLWYEFALLGLISGITAVMAAEITLGLLQTHLFDFPWQFNVSLWVSLPLISTLLLGGYGFILANRLLKKNYMAYQYEDNL